MGSQPYLFVVGQGFVGQDAFERVRASRRLQLVSKVHRYECGLLEVCMTKASQWRMFERSNLDVTTRSAGVLKDLQDVRHLPDVECAARPAVYKLVAE